MSGSWYRDAFDALYLELYAHRDAAEAERVTQGLLVPLGLPGKRVLDLACGAGRYARALADRGARVVGLDLSPALLAVARGTAAAAAAPFGLVRGDMLRLPFTAGCFDLVLSMFTSFGYFASAEEDRAMLRGVRRVLRPAGALLLDLFNAEGLPSTLQVETERNTRGTWVRERRRIDAERNAVVKEIEVRAGDRVRRYVEQVRLWPRPALRAALAASGLDPVHEWGDYGGAAFEPEQSERLIVLARTAPARC